MHRYVHQRKQFTNDIGRLSQKKKFVNSFSQICKRNISCIILVLSINFVVNKHEAFFWWDGAEAYTLMYSLSLFLFSFVIKIYFSKKFTTRLLYVIISTLLAMIIGGGNFSTSLLTVLLLLCFVFVVFMNKRKLLPYYLLIILVLLAGFIISIIAPGNSVRAATEKAGESPVKAIVHSVFYAVTYIVQWTGFAQIAGFIIIAIIAMICTKKTKCQYKYPLLVFIISVLVFAAQFTPPLYAISSIGSGRQVNIYYYSYYLFISFNIFYFCGWLNKKRIIKVRTDNIKKSYVLCGLLMLICMFIGGCINYRLKNLTFVDTMLALKNGTPQMYSMEYKERIEEIKSGKTMISDVKTIPDFFAPLNIKEDPDYWTNRGIAKYYNVENIILKSE